MDFILNHDWLHRGSDRGDFLSEETIQHSNLSRIISGTFRDPLISDEESDEDRRHDIDALLKTKQDNFDPRKKEETRAFVPGLRQLPLFPRQSSLTVDQHSRGVRYLATLDPTIATYRPDYKATRIDKTVLEEIKEEYAKEQKEFREWAAREWVEKQCIRALRPIPILERIYEGDWSTQIATASSLPLHYEYAAQITIPSDGEEYQLEFVEDLKKVELSQLPVLTIPAMDRMQSITFPLPEQYIPKSCRRHPCRIVLPDENETSCLPLREIHIQLAKYAGDRKAACIISEQALRSLVNTDTEWTLPVSVHQVSTAEGLTSVTVVSGPVHPKKQLTRARTARALTLLLRHHLTRCNQKDSSEKQSNKETEEETTDTRDEVSKDSDTDDSEDEKLCIDLDTTEKETVKPECSIGARSPRRGPAATRKTRQSDRNPRAASPAPPVAQSEKLALEGSQLLGTTCTCKGTPFEKPPHMSYKKWMLKSKDGESIPIIVYTSHKTRIEEGGEVMVHGMAEYQVGLGATAVSVGRLRDLALALTLRHRPRLLSARIDALTGQIVTLQYTEERDLMRDLADEPDSGRQLTEEAVRMAGAALAKLCTLKPSQYVLDHQTQHGENALLFVCSNGNSRTFDGQAVSLAPDDSYREEKERSDLQVPPKLSRAVLPTHKMRRLLPLAFSPYPPRHKPKPTKHDKKKAALATIKKLKNARKRQKQKLKKKHGKQ